MKAYVAPQDGSVDLVVGLVSALCYDKGWNMNVSQWKNFIAAVRKVIRNELFQDKECQTREGLGGSSLDDSLTLAYKAGYRDAIGSSEFCKRFLEIMKGCAYYPDTSSERSALAKLAQDLESL